MILLQIPAAAVRRNWNKSGCDSHWRKTKLTFHCSCLFALFVLATSHRAYADIKVESLAGDWKFIRGGPRLEDHAGKIPDLTFSDSITLPGTTDTNKKGQPSSDHSTYSFTQPYAFSGTCWYERDINVPMSWNGKRVTLFLERTKYTQVWLDGQPVGDNNICCSPQEYQLSTNLASGTHKLIIAVDNQRLPPFGADSHQFSGNTQGNWNGIIGRIELQMTDQIWIDDVQIYPDAATRQITVKLSLTNTTAASSVASITLNDKEDGPSSGAILSTKVTLPVGSTATQMELSLGSKAALWDEFHPAMHQLTVTLKAIGSEDERHIRFGLRNFVPKGQQFTNNGQPVFLRGKHDACVFPLTGHPPMDVDGWLKYLRICQSYGLNHIRFHSWTPPDAAFQAADQLGFYLQPELPFWGGFDQQVKDALKPEAEHILKWFGNHPSFVMFSMGNENWADPKVLASIVSELKAMDSRRLYVRGTNAFTYLGRPGDGDDYLVSAGVKPDPNGPLLNVRGSNAGSPKDQGHVQTGPANTMTDYSKAIAGTNWPTVTHEMGQYSIFPDFKQIAKYTGVSKPYNIEHIQQNLTNAGMADQATEFANASGSLAALCYREEIESCLRTPNYGGFELLDLQDYPGQGSALVGILDSLMDSKGIITPEQWRQFCAPVVLLAKFPKYTWTTNEKLTATIEVAQYGEKDLHDVVVHWAVKDAKGKALLAGQLPSINAERGNLRPIGKLSISLAGLTSPAALQLELSVDPTLETSYPFWVYAPKVNTVPPSAVEVARSFNRDTQKALSAGKRVLLVCDHDHSLINSVGGGFASDFWDFNFFHGKPGTMGLLCDPGSPALSGFPTQSHSNWQWFNLAMNSQPLILDTLLPKGERTLVQVIDNYERCHKIGLIFEVKVGAGRLLICTTDLTSLAADHPEARQLLSSLLSYTASSRFNPKISVSVAALQDLFLSSIPMTGCKVTASSYDHGWQGYAPEQVIDGNDAKAWQADPNASGDSWCQIEFPAPTDLHGGEILWPDSKPGYKYIVQSSKDGSQWQLVSDQRDNHFTEARHRIPMQASGVKFLRVTVYAMPDQKPAAINEIRFYPGETE